MATNAPVARGARSVILSSASTARSLALRDRLRATRVDAAAAVERLASKGLRANAPTTA